MLIVILFGIGPFQAVFIFRLSSFLKKRNVPIVYSLLTKLNMMLNGIEISSYCEIGPGFFIAHSNGIVIGKNAVIGKNLTIFQNSTIGAKSPFDGKEDMPQIGDNVNIYAGAKVLGRIKVGDYCKIGANVVLTTDLHNNRTVVIDRACIKEVESK